MRFIMFLLSKDYCHKASMQNVFKRVVMQNSCAYLTDCRGFVNALHNFIQKKQRLKNLCFFCDSIYQIIKTILPKYVF